MAEPLMDDLDFAILREVSHPQTFQWNVRLSYADIARAVKADEETVRLRVRRLEESGIVPSWEVAVHPALLGRCLARLDTGPVDEPRLEEAIATATRMDGARLLFEYFGGRIGVAAYLAGDPAVAARELAEAIGAPVRSSVLTLPPTTARLDATDWRIAHALREAPRGSYSQLAQRVAIPERTLARRVERMIEARAFYLNPDVDFARMQGTVPCVVRVAFRPGAQRGPVEQALRALPRVVFRWAEGDEIRVSFNAATLLEADAIRRDLAQCAGEAASVSLDLTMRRTTLRGWLDAEVARRAADGVPGTPREAAEGRGA